MESTRAEPYLAAELRGEQAEFDLSGELRFNLTLVITLHAKAPILINTHDTFLDPLRAREEGGIIFTDRDNGKSVVRSYTQLCFLNGGPPTTPTLFLAPGKTVLTNIPFNASPENITHPVFDMFFIFNIGGFETGCTFEGQLPTDKTIKYWRWATPDETGGQGGMVSAITSAVSSVIQFGATWWNGDPGTKKIVQLPLEKEQLPIHIEGSGVVFTCTGKKMLWPAEDSVIWDRNKPGYKERQERARAEYVKKNEKKWAEVEESNRKYRERMAAEREARGEAPWPLEHHRSGPRTTEYLERKAAEEKAKEDQEKNAAAED